MRPLLPLLILLLALNLTGCKLPKTSYVTTKARVLKVYQATDGGFRYTAYVVDRAGTEVVVTDPQGKSTHKVGDTIEYLDQKIDLPGGPQILNFTLLK